MNRNLLFKAVAGNVQRYFLLITMNWIFVAQAQTPWWDSQVPLHISGIDTNQAATYHAKMSMRFSDPNFGLWFANESNAASLGNGYNNAGCKTLGYFETFGDIYVPICEIDTFHPAHLLCGYWSWSIYSGKTQVWGGDWTWFDDASFARPLTRTHPLFGGSPMTYPSGTIATGYINNQTNDPRKCRVYDAGCSKDIFGNITVSNLDTVTSTIPTLLQIPGTGNVGIMFFAKDANCPGWVDYASASTKFHVTQKKMSGIWSDNFSSFDSFGGTPVTNGFGEWSVAKFRDHLTTNFSLASLKSMGVVAPSGTIQDVDTFNVRNYLQKKALTLGWDGSSIAHAAWTNNAWLTDEVWKAYVIFKRQSGTQALQNYYNAVKSSTAAAGCAEFLIMGNDNPVLGDGWLRGSLDMVSTEFGLGWNPSCGARGWGLPLDGVRAPFYKVALELAKGRFANMWLYNDQYVNELKNSPVILSLYYEMLANHTFPHYDVNDPHYVGTPADRQSFSTFVATVADTTFGMRSPAEDVGILYSTSTYNANVKPGANWPQTHNETWGWGVALSTLHYQIRMIPEWKLTPQTLSGLKVLVIGGAEVIDSTWKTMLTNWVTQGGILIVTGASGKTLSEADNFKSSSTLTLSSLTGVSYFALAPATLTTHVGAGVVFYIKQTIGNDYFQATASARPAKLTVFNAYMTTLLSGQNKKTLVLNTTAPNTAGITLYEDTAGDQVFVDVNNRDITVAPNGLSATVTDVPVFHIAIAKPTWWGNSPLASAKIISPDPIGTPTASIVNDTILLDIPSVKYYASVILTRNNPLSVNTLPEDAMQIKLIPNPSRGEFELFFSAKNENSTVIEISNMLGEIVYTETVQNFTGTYDKHINLSDRHSGTYLVQIRNGQRYIARKLIIN